MATDSRLRYLDADRVETPLPQFAAADLVDGNGRKLGSVDGVVVDPAARRALYLVIRRHGFLRARRELLPIADVHIEPERHALRIESEASLQAFDRDCYPDFSDDDLLTAMFAERAA